MVIFGYVNGSLRKRGFAVFEVYYAYTSHYGASIRRKKLLENSYPTLEVVEDGTTLIGKAKFFEAYPSHLKGVKVYALT